MSILDICWKCVKERVLLGLWLVNQVEESAPPAARRVLRRMAQPAKDFSVTAVRTKCGASFCNTRPDISRKAELDQFVKWLTGKTL